MQAGSGNEEKKKRRSWLSRKRKSRSVLDVREALPEVTISEAEPNRLDIPVPSLKKRFWKSFRRSTRNLISGRSKSKERLYEGNDSSLRNHRSVSQPNVSNYDLAGLSKADNNDNVTSFGSPNTSEGYSSRLSSGSHVGFTLHMDSDMSHHMSSIGEDFSNYGNHGNEEVDSGIVLGESQESAIQRRIRSFRAHPFFQLDMVLKEGRDLVVRDSCGTSDPYVKFKVGGKQMYKSRIVYKNLNPVWDEKFSIPIEAVQKPVQVKVFDYDRGFADDNMGTADIDLTELELNQPKELQLHLTEKGKSEEMGYITVQCTLLPKTQHDKEQYFNKSVRIGDSAKKLKMQIWSSVVSIVLIEGHDLLPMDDNGLSDPYVKFKLGNEKYKSKFKPKTLNPKWLEQFDLHMYDEKTKHLELTVWDRDYTERDDFMGRAMIDLTHLEKEKTHELNQCLEDGAGYIKILLTISGTLGSESVSDLNSYTANWKEREDIIRNYGLLKSFSHFKDIGWLQVKVIKAQGLASADLGGKSDPFCVLQLVNDRLQTQTEYKTLNPEWQKVFTFNVKDIHSVLEVIIFDEDRDKKSEFLGKVSIPLFSIKCGECRWYALKDKKLLYRAKGSIQLEMDIIYNHFKAGIRTVNPREEQYMQPEPKFKINLLKANVERVSKIVSSVMSTAHFLQSCWSWESKSRSSLAFIAFLVLAWNFELYLLPVSILLIFLWNLMANHVVSSFTHNIQQEYYDDEDSDDSDDDEKEGKEEKRSFKEKLDVIQNICLQVQEVLDKIASLGERIKNAFNWTVPWLSSMACIVLCIVAAILYYIPFRWIVLAWGINKFTKKIRKPNAIPNNEILDYLSRIPSDKELVFFRQLRPDTITESGGGRKKKTL